ncbi:MAG: hypothetical protein JOZ22_11480, partial [Acidobacteriia bacterium]|nr:hypothetical protein [Terriglobia bacterium]
MKVVDRVPGPIPPGLNPQVDVSWSIIPEKIVRDNFGHGVSKNFYGIEVVIGNNSGYNLQIAAVGFETRWKIRNPEGTETKAVYLKLPASSYRITRGSLERIQEFGRRAIFINTISTIGLIGVGVTPFFRAAIPSRNWSAGTTVFTGPLEKGLEIIVPDTTVRQLARLDDMMLRDGTIIPNNQQIRTRIFIPQDVVLELLPDPVAGQATLSKEENAETLTVSPHQNVGLKTRFYKNRYLALTAALN